MKEKAAQPYIMMATKVSQEAATLIERIAKKNDLSIYSLMQMICDVIIRYMDDQHNLSEDMQILMSIFERFNNWEGAFNIADPTTKKSISSAVYFMRGEGKTGTRAALVNEPMMGYAEVDYNVLHILEHVFCEMFPTQYKHLRNIGVEMECNNVFETIFRLADMHQEDPDAIEFRKQMEDNRRMDTGRMDNDVLYNRGYKRQDTPAFYEKLHKTLFDEEGNSDSDSESESNNL